MAKKGFTIKLNTDLRDWLQAKADKDDRNLSNYICRVLEEHRRLSSMSHCGGHFGQINSISLSLPDDPLNPNNVR